MKNPKCSPPPHLHRQNPPSAPLDVNNINNSSSRFVSIPDFIPVLSNLLCIKKTTRRRRGNVKPQADDTTEKRQRLGFSLIDQGKQSPGGHNVVWLLHEALKIHNPKSVLLQFQLSITTCGSEGLYAQKTLDDVLATYKNQGSGYDLLGRTEDQIRTTEQVSSAMVAFKALSLDGLVIVGGVTSNTDAAQLAETFAEAKCSTKVVGVPVTLNRDLRNQFVEANVGFDTICKVNSQLIINVYTYAISAEKVQIFN
ncbi:hypothetical protein E3N88_21733 [Mikania micrantha]|uniref:Phosphofructokinase domain-containing protein n=1 Tax=Mikania micrantha TaxID=192012 RepID=A0A5N6N8D2_9ASTR|nr:hypothetical protein E3N88_21733 [Mikania micrantha]